MEITRLGIMGGTFNPIHLGHLMIAEEARQTFHLDKVLFIPSYITPNKHVAGATAEQRLTMVRLAIAAGTVQPKPISSGTMLRPDNPSLRRGLSITKATLAIYPVSSRIDRKKKSVTIVGKKLITLPTP